MIAEAQLPGDALQGFAPHQRGEAPRQGAFAFARILNMQHLRHRQAEHAVAEKFKPLI